MGAMFGAKAAEEAAVQTVLPTLPVLRINGELHVLVERGGKRPVYMPVTDAPPQPFSVPDFDAIDGKVLSY